MELLLIVGIIVVILFAAGILIYNGLVQRRLRIDEAFAQIEVQLKRRWDLIPNLDDAVKGYMGFEESVLTQVTEARANAARAVASDAARSSRPPPPEPPPPPTNENIPLAVLLLPPLTLGICRHAQSPPRARRGGGHPCVWGDAPRRHR